MKIRPVLFLLALLAGAAPAAFAIDINDPSRPMFSGSGQPPPPPPEAEEQES